MLTGVKYRYAADDNGAVVDIESEDVVPSKDYICLSCDNILRPVLGQIMQKHYRHKVQANCSIETYLHNLAKKMFYQTYMEYLKLETPYEIEYKVQKQCTYCQHGPCNIGTLSKRTDITRYFNEKEIYVEKRDGAFTPDILLRNDKDSLYVEIAVKHYVEEPKLNSGVRIVEISVNDEIDVDLIRSGFLSVNDKRVRTYNFRPVPVLGDFKEECKKNRKCFILYPSGKSRVKSIHVWEQKKLTSEGIHVDQVRTLEDEAYIHKVAKVFKLGLNIKNCWLCTYHCLNFRTKDSFCKILKEQIEPNQAVECTKYRPMETIPACGLIQSAVNELQKGSRKMTRHPKVKSTNIVSIPEAEDLGTEPVEAFFHGMSLECVGCNALLHLVTFVQFVQSSKELHTFRVMGETRIYYNRKALFSVLAAIKDGSELREIGSLVSASKGLAVQCGKCSEVNFPSQKAKDEKQIYHGCIKPSDYMVLRREVFSVSLHQAVSSVR